MEKWQEFLPLKNIHQVSDTLGYLASFNGAGDNVSEENGVGLDQGKQPLGLGGFIRVEAVEGIVVIERDLV